MRKHLPWLTLIFGAVVLATLSRPPPPPVKGPHNAPVLPRIEFLRLLGASQLPLVTDYFWIQTIQAVARSGTPETYLDVFHYADLVTDLDPKFYYVYKFTGTTIPMNVGRWTWANVKEGQEILEKGVRQFPDDWKLRSDLGYNLGVLQNEYAAAAPHFEHAAKLPGAPNYMMRLATLFLSNQKNFGAALQLARTLRDQSEDPDVKEMYEKRILEIRTEMVLQEVDRAAAHYKERTGQPPQFIHQLLASGDLPAPPEDPAGGIISLDSKGTAQSSVTKTRLVPVDFRERFQKKNSAQAKP